jgi:hypothetical protein
MKIIMKDPIWNTGTRFLSLNVSVFNALIFSEIGNFIFHERIKIPHYF